MALILWSVNGGRDTQTAEIEIKGRHDPAIPPRIVHVVEAMVALMLADHMLRQRAGRLLSLF